MSSFRVDAEAVKQLGLDLLDLADELGAQGEGDDDAWALGHGEAAAAFVELVGRWRLERGRLCTALSDLGEAAVTAGGLYVDVESLVGRSMVGGVQ